MEKSGKLEKILNIGKKSLIAGLIGLTSFMPMKQADAQIIGDYNAQKIPFKKNYGLPYELNSNFIEKHYFLTQNKEKLPQKKFPEKSFYENQDKIGDKFWDVLNFGMRILYESAVETDRYQSENWWYGTKKDPVISPNGIPANEGNKLIAGTTYENFQAGVNVAKYSILSLPHILKNKEVADTIILFSALIELINVIRNNQKSEHLYGFPTYTGIGFTVGF